MEAFKAVEKEMKTKAFSKEGLSASAKMDPKEREKEEMAGFLADMVEELGRQIESVEAEAELVQVTTKKSKKDTAKAERLQELEHTTERHKWHQSKLELLMRALANDDVELDQVKDIQDGIKDYVENNQEVDFFEDDGIYEDLHLEEEEGRYGIAHDPTLNSENQSVLDDSEPGPSAEVAKVTKVKSATEGVAITTRRPSMAMKSPLPALATIHTLPTASTIVPAAAMKPAPPPAKPAGEPLKYASAAAAAAASDKAGVGIAPLPPPTIAAAALTPGLSAAHLNFPGITSVRSSTASTPAFLPTQPVLPMPTEARVQPPVAASATPPIAVKSPAPSHPATSAHSPARTPAIPPTSQPFVQQTPSKQPVTRASSSHTSETISAQSNERTSAPTPASSTPQVNGDRPAEAAVESVFHLPSILQELYDSLEYVKNRADAEPITSVEHQRRLHNSYDSRPDTFDAEKPRHYRPDEPSLATPIHYPQHPLPIFDDPRLYTKVDTDALFYSFYYRQGTYQQYLAAKALKTQSWRFHKQYQTWFQRHEEPKNITEDYEQGTYRFFDYESTWYDFHCFVCCNVC